MNSSEIRLRRRMSVGERDLRCSLHRRARRGTARTHETARCRESVFSSSGVLVVIYGSSLCKTGCCCYDVCCNKSCINSLILFLKSSQLTIYNSVFLTRNMSAANPEDTTGAFACMLDVRRMVGVGKLGTYCGCLTYG